MTEPAEQNRPPPAAPRDGSPRVHGTAQLRNAVLGRFTELKERVQFCDSMLGDYSYVERHSEVIYADIGKFCAIAADVRINALNHPMERISQHKITYRPNEYFTGAKIDKAFRQSRIAKRVEIGHDVWIGHGAIIHGRRQEGRSHVSYLGLGRQSLRRANNGCDAVSQRPGCLLQRHQPRQIDTLPVPQLNDFHDYAALAAARR